VSTCGALSGTVSSATATCTGVNFRAGAYGEDIAGFQFTLMDGTPMTMTGRS
jgi:hypothetical protein